MAKKYVKKPVVIEAVRWTGDNKKEVMDFCGEECRFDDEDRLYILTLEGKMFASVYDYIIKGINGEFYPCKADIFVRTYNEVKDV